MVLGGRYAVHVPFMEWRTSGRFREGTAGAHSGMGVKPKATPQELEQLRWMEIFANDIALYRFDIQSVGQNEADPNEVRMTVQAIYTDKKS